MPGGFLGCLEAFGEMGCFRVARLAPPTSIFDEQRRKNFQPPSYEGATHWGRLGSSVLGLDFGVVGCLLGEVSTPRGGLPDIQAPEAHEKVFRGESDGQKRPKNRKPRKG